MQDKNIFYMSPDFIVTVYIWYTLKEEALKKKRTNILKDYFVERIFMSLPVYRAYQINVGAFHFKMLYP